MAQKFSRKQIVQSTLATAVIITVGSMLFFVAGYFFFVRPELRAVNEFQPADATIQSKEVVWETSGSGTKRKTRYRPVIRFSYVVDGKDYESSTYHLTNLRSSSKSWPEQVLAEFEIGQQYPCYYDPANPATAVLHRGVTLTGWLFTGGSIVAFVVGLVTLCVVIFRRTTGVDNEEVVDV